MRACWLPQSRGPMALRSPYGLFDEHDPELAGGVAICLRMRRGVRVVRNVGEQDPLQPRDDILEELESLGVQLEVEIGDTGHIPAGPRKASNDAEPSHVADHL